jgi:hypothetical protein
MRENVAEKALHIVIVLDDQNLANLGQRRLRDIGAQRRQSAIG